MSFYLSMRENVKLTRLPDNAIMASMHLPDDAIMVWTRPPDDAIMASTRLPDDAIMASTHSPDECSSRSRSSLLMVHIYCSTKVKQGF